MKRIILVLLIVFTATLATAQWSSYQLSPKGDTINCVDKSNKKQGPWVVRINALRGEPGYEEEGVFVDDRKEGVWRKYNLNGDLLGVENFKWGNMDGLQQYFTMYGDLLREESWRAINPENPYDTIDVPDLIDPNKIETKIVKQESNSVKHGTWKFYDPNTGMIIKTERFAYGQPEKGYGLNKGSTKKTTTATADENKTLDKPKEVTDWEKKNSGKKTIKVRDGRTG